MVMRPCTDPFGRPIAIRMLKGYIWECTRCGRRWSAKEGSRHPK